MPTAAQSSPVSVSGLSSGADMAAQLLMAYSSLFVGGGVFAGQAWHCAVQRFAEEPLLPVASSPNVPFCDGCPNGTTLSYDHCKKEPIDHVVSGNVSLLVAVVFVLLAPLGDEGAHSLGAVSQQLTLRVSCGFGGFRTIGQAGHLVQREGPWTHVAMGELHSSMTLFQCLMKATDTLDLLSNDGERSSSRV